MSPVPVLLWVKQGDAWIPLRDISGLRWGTVGEPSWTDGAITDNPGAGTALVSKTVTAGKTGQVMGISISAPEANEFQLFEDATAKLRFPLAAAGLIFIVAPLPIWDGVAAGVVLSIKNVSAASAAGKYYQARLLYREV